MDAPHATMSVALKRGGSNPFSNRCLCNSGRLRENSPMLQRWVGVSRAFNSSGGTAELVKGLSTAGIVLFFVLCTSRSDGAAPEPAKSFDVRGTIEQIQPESQRLVIQHDAISNYMDAMTMPFKVKDTAELRGLEKGDVVS